MIRFLLITLAAVTLATTVSAQEVEEITSKASGLEWTPPRLNTDGSVLDDLAGYKVYMNDSMIADTTSASYEWPQLPVLDGETAEFYVVAYDDAGNESAPSRKLTVVADLVGPDTPTGITITINQSVSITLQE